MTLQEIAIEYVDSRSELSFKQLYKTIYPRLRVYAKNFLKSYCFIDLEYNVDDVLSKTFQKAIENINQYNKLWNFSTWIYAICKYELLIQRKHFHTYVCMSYLDYKISESSDKKRTSYEVPADTSIYDPLVMQEDKKYINDLFNMALEEIILLPELYKDILIDREINNMNYEDISKKYMLPINTVKSRIRLGRSIIRQNITKEIGKVII